MALDAFRQLRPHDRHIIALVAAVQPTIDELAGELGCSTSAAAVRLFRARRRLEAVLDDESI